jgi:hypothetical protein
MTPRDAYWGAKLVASFSDEQVRAAVDAAEYQDPRAADTICSILIERRNRIVRHWFGRVAPLDFFAIDHGRLVFHDLARDLGLVGARAYLVHSHPRVAPGSPIRLGAPELDLATLDPGGDRRVTLTLHVADSDAAPVTVEIERVGGAWRIARVRHA